MNLIGAFDDNAVRKALLKEQSAPIIDPSKPILVFLAGSVQGSAVARTALARGLAIRALLRDQARAAALFAPGVELIQGDLVDVMSLRAACAGIVHAVL